MRAAATGAHRLDAVHHVLAFHNLSKHGVAPALGAFRFEIQEVVVGHVNEELGGCRVRVHGAGHGHGVGLVGQAVVGLVLDWRVGRLLRHVGGEAAALDHEAVDHAMEDGAVVMAALYVLFKVGGGFRGFVGEQFQYDGAEVGGQFDHGVSLMTGRAGSGLPV